MKHVKKINGKVQAMSGIFIDTGCSSVSKIDLKQL